MRPRRSKFAPSGRMTKLFGVAPDSKKTQKMNGSFSDCNRLRDTHPSSGPNAKEKHDRFIPTESPPASPPPPVPCPTRSYAVSCRSCGTLGYRFGPRSSKCGVPSRATNRSRRMENSKRGYWILAPPKIEILPCGGLSPKTFGYLPVISW